VICADASVAAKWILPEEQSVEARSLYRATLGAGERIVAPPLLPIEVTNILRRRVRAGDLALPDAMALLGEFLRFPITLVNPVGLHQQALLLADRFGLAAAYDAHYLALAEGLGCELWTDDRRLLAAVGRELPSVRWIGDFRADDVGTA